MGYALEGSGFMESGQKGTKEMVYSHAIDKQPGFIGNYLYLFL
jgi:hypothetical protein